MQLADRTLWRFWEAGSLLEPLLWEWLASSPWHCLSVPLLSFCVLVCFPPFCSALSSALCPILALSLAQFLLSLGLAGHSYLVPAVCSRFTQTGFPFWCLPSGTSWGARPTPDSSFVIWTSSWRIFFSFHLGCWISVPLFPASPWQLLTCHVIFCTYPYSDSAPPLNRNTFPNDTWGLQGCLEIVQWPF